jgi:hypothetical protein
MPHLCPAPGCGEIVPRTMLACRKHWFSLPKAMRNDIWRAWRRDPYGDEHQALIAEAIEWLEERP